MIRRLPGFTPTSYLLASILAVATAASAQQQPAEPDAATPAPPHGTVLFDSDKNPSSELKKHAAANEDNSATISDADRAAITFTAYDLDAHLTPAHAHLVMRASLSIRNDGPTPLARIALQISSSLQWERFAVLGTSAPVNVPFVQHLIDTDADNSGQAQEAILTLPQPLQPGATITLSTFYSGQLDQSSKRLERIGAPPAQASFADWDAISADSTSLRGFGNVLWYPVAAAPVFLGDGAKLFQSVGETKLRQSKATIRLRLAVEYVGDAPQSAYFCGERQPLTPVSENVNEPVVEAPGLATAEFSTRTLGFRVPSLFITDRAATNIGTFISAVTDRDQAPALYAATADKVQPLLSDWLGKTPLTTLNILDHEGQPFEDDALLVGPMSVQDSAGRAFVLIHALSHAWFAAPQAWLDEGIPQFLSLLWVEQTEGRDAAINQIEHASTTLALAEPTFSQNAAPATEGQSLIHARDEVYFRTKAASVLWMLRSVTGDEPLKQALQLLRRDSKRDDPNRFQQLLEQTSHKDLQWFFDDWVYRDRGLPDLSIVSVIPRELPARADKPGGWLVAVEVRNDGDAVAEVPVTIRAGSLTATERVRIPARSSTSTRIVFETDPTEVLLNDGTVPETTNSRHSKQVIIRDPNKQ